MHSASTAKPKPDASTASKSTDAEVDAAKSDVSTGAKPPGAEDDAAQVDISMEDIEKVKGKLGPMARSWKQKRDAQNVVGYSFL